MGAGFWLVCSFGLVSFSFLLLIFFLFFFFVNKCQARARPGAREGVTRPARPRDAPHGGAPSAGQQRPRPGKGVPPVWGNPRVFLGEFFWLLGCDCFSIPTPRPADLRGVLVSPQAPPLPLRAVRLRFPSCAAGLPPPGGLGGPTCQNNNNHKGGRGALSLHPPIPVTAPGSHTGRAVPGAGTAGVTPGEDLGRENDEPPPSSAGQRAAGRGGKGRGSCAGVARRPRWRPDSPRGCASCSALAAPIHRFVPGKTRRILIAARSN